MNDKYDSHSEEWKAVASLMRKEFVDRRKFYFDDRDGQYWTRDTAYCPMCGDVLHDWEGQTGEEMYTGRAIVSSCLECYACGWESRLIRL